MTLLAACRHGTPQEVRNPTSRAGTSSPTATASGWLSTASPVPTASPEQAVLAAYERYWDVYSAALLSLDGMPVRSVAAEAEYDRIQQEIDGLQSQGVALRVSVTRHHILVEVKDGSAIVFDEMVNNSFYVDAISKQPSQGTGSGETLRDTYYLKTIDGQWKVTMSTRQR